jgi:hypothetical protein
MLIGNENKALSSLDKGYHHDLSVRYLQMSYISKLYSVFMPFLDVALV